MSEVPGMLAHQLAFSEMAEILHGLLSEGDECIYYVSNWMGPFGQAKFWAVRPDGESVSPIGRANSIRGPQNDDFDRAEERLRDACYTPGRGTWFGLAMRVTPDGQATVEYNYDRDPVWTREIEPTIYVQEQEMYPRDEEHQPEWFKERLAVGQVVLGEWRRNRSAT